MKTWMKLGLGVLVLATSALTVEAQRRPGEPPAPSDRCACSAGGVECLFGSAGGCSVTCAQNTCRCEGAWCFLGFPRASKCTCDGGASA